VIILFSFSSFLSFLLLFEAKKEEANRVPPGHTARNLGIKFWLPLLVRFSIEIARPGLLSRIIRLSSRPIRSCVSPANYSGIPSRESRRIYTAPGKTGIEIGVIFGARQ